MSEQDEVNVILGRPSDRRIEHDVDVFEKSLEELSNVEGLSPNIRRKITRMEKRLDSVDGSAGSKQLEPQVYTAYATLDLMQPPNNVDYLAALYNTSPVLRGAIQAKVANIVGMGYDFVESPATLMKVADTDDPKKIRKIRKQIRAMKTLLSEKLEECNSELTFTEIMTRVYTDVESLGYGCLEVGRKSNGEIGYIGHVPAKTVRVRRKRDGYVQMIAEKAVFFRNFGDRTTTNPVGNDPQPNEMMFFLGGNYSPDETYYGVPGAVPATQAIAGNEFSGRFNLDYFENKALPRYVFVVKGVKLSQSSQQRLTEFFETMRGQNHRTLVVPLPADTDGSKSSFEMMPVETGVQDSSFMNYRRGNMQEILMAYRVPANKLGITEGIDLASARDASKNFSETVTRPEQKNVERRINRIIGEWGDALKFKFKETALSDDTELSKQDQVYLTFGVETPNDVRQRWGWPPLENGDLTVTELQAKLAQDAADKAADVAMQQQDKAAEMQANSTPTRARDTQRAANTSDSTGNARATKGDGRAQQ